MTRTWPTRLGGAALLLAGFSAGDVAAQGLNNLVAACAIGVDLPDLARCRAIALAAQAAQGDVALLAAGGAELPGAASSLGKRVGSSPRISFVGRVGGVGFEAPALTSASAPSVAGQSGLGVALQGTVALGLLRGFSPTPTMGGVLSVDLLANGSLLRPPGSLGYTGTEFGYGIGARVGILRESFTLPGVTVSATQRWVQGIELGAPRPGDSTASLRFGVSTTSLRGLVGKDLWGIGWLGGVGWDRSSSDGTVPTLAGGEASFVDFDNSRTLLFAGASWSYFLIQISGEAGWASGWITDVSPTGDTYDPGSGRLFGGLAIRFIY